MASLDLIFLVVALICFLAAAGNVVAPRINFLALGLASWVASIIF
jgi:hypothetical protein